MMLAAVSAIGLPTIAGALLVWALDTRSMNWHRALFAAGAGFMLGFVGVSLGMQWLPRVGVGEVELVLLIILLLVIVGAALAIWLRSGAAELAVPEPTEPLWVKVVTCSLLLLLLLGWLLALREIVSRPVFPWDAWSAWLVKARVWFELGQQVEFVDPASWLAEPAPQRFTNEAWQYPEALPLYQLWVLRWGGVWHSSAALLPWSATYLTLLALSYSALRSAGLPQLYCVGASYFSLALPILNVQVALAGYADIWVATSLVLFVAAWLRWYSTAQRRWWWLAALALVSAALIKVEGVVWLAIGLLALFAAALPHRWRRWLALLVTAGAAVWLLLGGVAVELPLLGRVALTPELLELPLIGRFPLRFSNSSAAFAEAFFLLPNWHLLWVLFPPAAAVLGWHYRRQAAGALLITLCALGFGFLATVFFFSHAALWAESMTASNRVALQLMPGLTLLSAAMLGHWLWPQSQRSVSS